MNNKKITPIKKETSTTYVNQINTGNFFNYETGSYLKKQICEVIKRDKKPVLVIDMNNTNEYTTQLIIDRYTDLDFLKLSQKYILIFCSEYSFFVIKPIIIDLFKIRNGYIVCNNGARIYDLSKDTFIFESILDEAKKKAVTHLGILNELGVTVSTLQSSLSYTTNEGIHQRLKNKLRLDLQYTNDYLTFDNYVNLNRVCSIILSDIDETNVTTKCERIKGTIQPWEVKVSYVINNKFVITNANAAMINAVYSILEMHHYKDLDDLYYIGVNSFDYDLWFQTNDRHILCQEVFDNNKALKNIKLHLSKLFKSSDSIETINAFTNKILDYYA